MARAAEGGEKVLGVLIREDRGCAPLVVGVSCMGHGTTTSSAVHEANNQ